MITSYLYVDEKQTGEMKMKKWNRLTQLEKYALEDVGYNEEEYSNLSREKRVNVLIRAKEMQVEELHWLMKSI